MKKYESKKIEKKWQSVWRKKKTFAAQDKSNKPTWYTLVEFPYPSGAGMHVGHVRSYTALDILSRKRRMEGYNVLYPMGWDAFGLPTENYAIKTGISPQVATKKNTDNFRKQLQSLGYSFDWAREVNSTDPNYYKWTQWIFQQFFKAGLAYKAKMAINWCPKDKIGLANEEVIQGKCERCGTAVEQRQKEQWMLKITAYADKLLAGLKDVDYLPEIKAQQENWIGRSEGAEIDFSLTTGQEVKVFTTRPDTLFGATYLVLAPEHALVAELKERITNWAEVEKYIAATKLKGDLERQMEDSDPSASSVQGKTGVELKGIKAINPANKEEIPVWISDYVLSSYGTGAIMAVPAHDERDFAFAKKFALPIKEVIEPMIEDVSGKDAVRPGLPLKKRDCVICVVKHWKEDKYLCLRWKNMPWRTFVVGGVEVGEDEMAAAIREVAEESGYTSARFIRRIDGAVRSRFYHELKKENRDGRYQGFYFELADDSRRPLSESEAAIHETLWVDRAEVEKLLTSEDFKILWRRLFNASAYSGTGTLLNSGKFDGMNSEDAKKAITEFVGGKITVKYKLRDWVFSRQRYWGEPIPLINCEKCGWVCVPEKDLPVKLPKVDKYQPTDTGESPLSTMPKWVNVKCPECKGPAKRETDTMPNWAGSSWYFLSYLMSRKAFKGKASLKAWQTEMKNFKQFMPVNWYNGGMEHVTLHLLYSRFWNQFLHDHGLVPTKEPYQKRTAHGMILAADGKKMSKSLGNVVNPDDLVKEFGADALRLYELFIGPFNQAVSWDPRGILGCSRFLEKVWRIGQTLVDSREQIVDTSAEIKRLLHKTIKKVGDDIEAANFNTAVSAMMIFVNELNDNSAISLADWQRFLAVLSPFAPHLADELWTTMKAKGLACEQSWPTFDPGLLEETEFDLVVQVNSRVRSTLKARKGITQEEAETLARGSADVAKWMISAPKRVIFVKDRLINFIL